MKKYILDKECLRRAREHFSSLKDEDGNDINLANPPFVFSKYEIKIIKRMGIPIKLS